MIIVPVLGGLASALADRSVGFARGSTLGQVLGLSDARLRLLVACGAAGGISAMFNAPIPGIMFALELILRDFEAQAVGAAVLTSVAADV